MVEPTSDFRDMLSLLRLSPSRIAVAERALPRLEIAVGLFTLAPLPIAIVTLPVATLSYTSLVAVLVARLASDRPGSCGCFGAFDHATSPPLALLRITFLCTLCTYAVASGFAIGAGISVWSISVTLLGALVGVLIALAFLLLGFRTAVRAVTPSRLTLVRG